MQVSYYLPKIKAVQAQERELRNKMNKLQETMQTLENERENASEKWIDKDEAMKNEYVIIN
jgi:prefoldin subunit 5